MFNIFKNKKELENLKRQLQDAGIDLSLYGKCATKNIDDLLEEIKSGETVLSKNKDGKLLRNINVGSVDIFYTNKNGEKFKLKEDKQSFKDGCERKRKLPGSVSGKIKKGENPEETIIREVKEELGIICNNLSKGDIIVETKISSSYPGLLSQYTTHHFSMNILDKDFKPEGYIEKTNRMKIFFIWEKIK